MKKVFLFAAVLGLAACGGGGGGNGTSNVVTAGQAPVEPPVDTAIVLGGTASAPALLGLNSKNTISNNSFNNYFKYSAVAGERLVVRVNLNQPLSDAESARCASNPDAYSTQIYVYNSKNVKVGGVCGEDLTYTFSETGVYVLSFDFPSNGSGFFNAASLKGDTPVKFLATGSGTPGEPKLVNTGSANSIGSNVFTNYYWIAASKGETIVINATLNQPLSAQQKTRCAANSAQLNSRIFVYDDKLNYVGVVCGEGIRFQVPQSGNYIFHFSYGSQNSGVFNAAKI